MRKPKRAPPRDVQRAADRLSQRLKGALIERPATPGVLVVDPHGEPFFATPATLTFLGVPPKTIQRALEPRVGQVPVVVLYGDWVSLRWWHSTTLVGAPGGAA